MNVLFIMIPIALILAFSFIGACLYALSSGQFDDLETPSLRILKEDTQKEIFNEHK